MSEDFRKQAPAPLEPVPFNVPELFEGQLDNGLRVVILEDHRLPLVSFRLAFKIGDANDPPDAVGLTSAMAAMLNEGTRKRTSKQLASEIERLGASISASSNTDNTIVGASVLSLYRADVLRLLADMALNSVFPEDELELYKQNTIQALIVQRSDAGFLASEQIARILYGKSPYGIISPKPEDIEMLTAAQLREFHKKMLIPNSATLIIVGDVQTSEIMREIEAIFGTWQPGKVEEFKLNRPPERAEPTITLVDRPGSAQTNIILGNIGLRRNHPDYFKALVMNQVLGAGPSARLFLNLREDKGYTYGAYSNLDTRRLNGTFEASAEVRTPVTGDSLQEFFYELNRIREERASDEELRNAQNFLTGVFPIRAETQEGLTNLITSQMLFDLPDDYLETYRDKVDAVTVDEVSDMANKYIHPDKIAIVLVGDAGEILPQVRSYAREIEVVDTDGKRLDLKSYTGAETHIPAVVEGTWMLEVDAQGQKLPVELSLEQTDNLFRGLLKSQLGSGQISGGQISGNKLKGTAKTDFQGQDIELRISATVEADRMEGTLDTGLPGFPQLPFRASRKPTNDS